MEHAHIHSPAPLPMHSPHVALRQAGLQALPVAQASSLRGCILATVVRFWPWPLVRRYEPGATKRLRAGSACIPDRLDDRHDPIRHPCDQDGEQYATRRIVSTAGAAAWLPHSKRRARVWLAREGVVPAPCAPEARAPSSRLGSTPVIIPPTRSGTQSMQYSSCG
ncbi:MAG: hypothetical protein KatS3mg056_3410 [Chloroflexus sp.]|nr:MAG: hypothetical protein KatS3mg056_3410 [Chloroflexus sp.]